MISERFAQVHSFFSRDKCQHRQHRYGADYYHTNQIDDLNPAFMLECNKREPTKALYFTLVTRIASIRRKLRSGSPV